MNQNPHDINAQLSAPASELANAAEGYKGLYSRPDPYQKTYDFGKIVGSCNKGLPTEEQIIIATGGGPSVMEAANLGCMETGCITAGFNISLPFEQEPNPYITPSLRKAVKAFKSFVSYCLPSKQCFA